VITTQAEGSESDQIRSTSNLPSLACSPPTHAHGADEDQATAEKAYTSPSATHERPARSAVISVAVIDEHSFTREAISRSLKETCELLDISSFATSDQCLNSAKNYDVILYHGYENTIIRNNTDIILADIKKLLATAPVILLCDVEALELMRMAFDNGVRGYIPTASTTLEVAVGIIYLVKAGGIFVPPSSLSLRKCKLSATHDPIATQKFTARQMAVLDRLKRGQTNKIIAFELNMSQSSVKTHIQNIMKKMNATNRTEVACLAQKLGMDKTRMIDNVDL
jgi:DNA-binding NarL/FixJ family response regulator